MTASLPVTLRDAAGPATLRGRLLSVIGEGEGKSAMLFTRLRRVVFPHPPNWDEMGHLGRNCDTLRDITGEP